MLITIITVSYNAQETIRETIESVIYQTYKEIEYIIIDGASTDQTLDIISEYKNYISKIISEPDKGIYNAINKGIMHANGKYIGILNADDVLESSDVIRKIVAFLEVNDLDLIFSNLNIVNRYNTGKIIRKYRIKNFSVNLLRIGIMPPHPTVFIKRSIYRSLGEKPYKENYKIAADFELMARLLTQYDVNFDCLQLLSVRMKNGGLSSQSIKHKIILNREIIKSCLENGIYTNWFILFLKFPIRIFEFLRW